MLELHVHFEPTALELAAEAIRAVVVVVAIILSRPSRHRR